MGLRLGIFAVIMLALTQLMPKRWYMGTEFLRWELVFAGLEKERKAQKPINIVLGDSRPEMGLNSCTLDAVNFGLGGTTPVEGYYILSQLSEVPIKKVYLSYSPFHIQSQDCFNNRAGYFGFVDAQYVEEVLAFSQSIKDTVFQYNNWVWLDELEKSYPNKWVQRQLRYLPSMRNLYQYQKYFATHQAIEEGIKANCQSYLFESDACPKGEAVYEVKLEKQAGRFIPNPVNVHYFKKMIELIQSRGISLEWINMPLNEGSIHPQPTYYNEFEAWLKPLLPAETNYHAFSFRPACDFVDLSHLNKPAANSFTLNLVDSETLTD